MKGIVVYSMIHVGLCKYLVSFSDIVPADCLGSTKQKSRGLENTWIIRAKDSKNRLYVFMLVTHVIAIVQILPLVNSDLCSVLPYPSRKIPPSQQYQHCRLWCSSRHFLGHFDLSRCESKPKVYPKQRTQRRSKRWPATDNPWLGKSLTLFSLTSSIWFFE